MSCDSTRLNLLAYVHNEVDPDLADAIERHLAACQLCAASADQLRAQAAKLSTAMVSVEIPSGLEHRVMQRLSRRAKARQAGWDSPLDWLRAGALAAASVLMAISGLSVVAPGTYAVLVANAAWLGGRFSELASQHISTWPALVRAIEALETLAGLAGL